MSHADTPFGVPKVCGADVEIANYIAGLETKGPTTGAAASRALLREFEGYPLVSRRHATSCGCFDCRPDGSVDRFGSRAVVIDPQDWGRRFLPSTGGCAYIDLNHLELCLPELRSAADHVAAWHATLRLARRALVSANAERSAGRIHALICNSDKLGHTWGSHLDMLVTRRAWDNLFHRRLHYLLYLASHQVSSIVFAGQGKVGSENGAPHADFQLLQRGDFFRTLVGPQTTFNRPLVNSRDEPLCGRHGRAAREDLARLHVIFYDSNLAQAAIFLKVGTLQLVVAMIEQDQVDPKLVLEDPLDALTRWNRDLTFTAAARTTAGCRMTAVEHQQEVLQQARRFCEAGRAAGIVPDADRILDLWEDTLVKLGRGDIDALSGRLDWALKRTVLERAMGSRPDLDWRSPEIGHLDQLYGSLDAREGLYWAYERAGRTESIVTEERIAALGAEPPPDTRAWTRAMSLRRAGAARVDDVDWDQVRVRTASGPGRFRVVDLPSPLEYTRADTEAIFRDANGIDELLDELGAGVEEPAATGWQSDTYDSWNASDRTH